MELFTDSSLLIYGAGVVGAIEFIKNVSNKKGLCKYATLQIIICLLLAFCYAIELNSYTFSLAIIVLTVKSCFLLLAITTLGYDLIVDRFKVKKENPPLT
jgi:hypothetical protein